MEDRHLQFPHFIIFPSPPNCLIMKKFLTICHNGQPLLGSDYSIPLPIGYTKRQYNNRVKWLRNRISHLKEIKPFLATGIIDFVVR